MPVGFREGLLKDAARTDWDGNRPRPLSYASWYPAAESAREAALVADSPTASWFTIGPAARDAPLDANRTHYPIVMLSHGTGGAAMNLEWLARDLAQRGFIAVAANHHGNTATGRYCAEGFLCWWERARDLTVLLDLLAAQGEFAGRIDMDRIFVAGYSLGGCTAAALIGAITATSRFLRSPANPNPDRGPREFPDLADHLPKLLGDSAVFRASWARMRDSYRDPRFKAALLLAPGRSITGFDEASLAAIATPSRIVVGAADFVAPAALWLQERLPGCTLDRLAAEAGHYVFLPEATEAGRRTEPACCVDAPGVDRRAIHAHVTALAADLFGANR